MRPRNFPANKLARQLVVQYNLKGEKEDPDIIRQKLDAARAIRSKKNRSSKSRY